MEQFEIQTSKHIEECVIFQSLPLKSNCDLVNIEHTCKDGGNIEKISTLSHMSYYSQA